MIARNEEFKEVHRYYRTRKENPLKKMQSVIAVACKVLRIFYTILTKGVTYDGAKMMQDIKRPQMLQHRVQEVTNPKRYKSRM